MTPWLALKFMREHGAGHAATSLKEDAKPGKVQRIFDRILEVCVPIMFDGDSFRKSTAADNLKKAARLLG